MDTANEVNEQEMAMELEKESRAYQGLGIKFLSIAGGLLGSTFIMGWVFLFLSGSSVASIIIGTIVLVAVVVLDKRANSTLVDTACIGAYLAACGLIGMGLQKAFESDNVTTLSFIIIAAAVPFFTTGYMLNFFSVLIFNICLFTLININHAYGIYHLLIAGIALIYALFSLYEAECLASCPEINVVYNPWRNALLCSFLALLAYLAVDGTGSKKISNEWVSSLSIIGIFLFFLHHVIQYLGIEDKRNRLLIYLVSVLVLLMAFFAPAICGALLVLLISFHTGHRFGLILGTIALIYFTGQFYYDLHYTLLIKSMMMMGTGVLFLSAWFIFKNTLKRYEQG